MTRRTEMPPASLPRLVHGARLAGLVLVLAVLAGCAASRGKAPVENRSTGARPTAPAPAPVAAPSAPLAQPPAAAALPGAENAGKPGHYTVRPGDTLIRIGLDNGQNWRDIARWNSLENPNLIEVGQVLRVVPPGTDPTVVAARPVTPAGRVESRPLPPAGAAAAPGAVSGSAAGSVSGAATAPAAAAAATTPPAASAAPAAPQAAATAQVSAREDDEVHWAWPASGAVLSGFEEGRSKGLAIGGKAGDPVLAAADGRVVYAGSGLRGYGNLVIVKHNATFLTAYAHNQTLLVKEDQVVRRGQRIAEMGSSDADRVQLHFEIRRLGKPVDPARLLPPR